MNYIDLRSDTVTKPTRQMVEFMMKADVGDDVYGEDPNANLLESTVAKLLGKEAGLFTPSGTMANQIAIQLHTQPGTSIVAEQESHVFLYEAGAAAALSGVQFDLIPFSENFSDLSIDERIRPEWMHNATTKLLIVENSHNRASGKVISVSEVQRIASRARHHGLKVHCDGARLWNAAQALNCSEKELTAPFDTVSVCFSKGLGAPVGSVLVGPKELIDRGRKIRKRWGGGMRQIGQLTAACLFALENHRVKLKDDHRRVKVLHDGLKKLQSNGLPISTKLPNIWTNILYFSVAVEKGDEIAAELKDCGVLLNHLGRGKLRAVTHFQISDEDIAKTLSAVERVLS